MKLLLFFEFLVSFGMVLTDYQFVGLLFPFGDYQLEARLYLL